MGFHYLENEELYEGALVRALRSARRSLWISTANVKQTRIEDPSGRGGYPPAGGYTPLIEFLARLARGGVDVRILHSADPSRHFVESLHESGALGEPDFAMRRCRRVHFKTVIADGASAYMGSANVTGAGLGAKGDNRRNFETGVWTDEAPIVRRLRELFSAVWSGAFCDECALRRTRRGQEKPACERPLAEPGRG